MLPVYDGVPTSLTVREVEIVRLTLEPVLEVDVIGLVLVLDVLEAAFKLGEDSQDWKTSLSDRLLVLV